MKKLILSIVALMAVVTSAKAQNDWKMVITQADGTKVEILTSEVKDIRYVENVPFTSGVRMFDNVPVCGFSNPMYSVVGRILVLRLSVVNLNMESFPFSAR